MLVPAVGLVLQPAAGPVVGYSYAARLVGCVRVNNCKMKAAAAQLAVLAACAVSDQTACCLRAFESVSADCLLGSAPRVIDPTIEFSVKWLEATLCARTWLEQPQGLNLHTKLS